MTIKYYLFAVSFYILGGFCLYFAGNKLLSRLNKETAQKLLPLVCIGLALAGVIFVNYAFFYHNSNVKVTSILLYSK